MARCFSSLAYNNEIALAPFPVILKVSFYNTVQILWRTVQRVRASVSEFLLTFTLHEYYRLLTFTLYESYRVAQ
jgi:hypothetical protein